MRRDAKAKERKRTLLVIGSAIAFCAILIGVVSGIAIKNSHDQAQKRKIPGLVKYDASKLGRKHTTAAVTYSTTPPVGGDHSPVWLNCGIYTTEQSVGMAVHDMEHGAVWITYGPKTSGAEIAKLQFHVRAATKGFITLTPFAALKPGAIFASAWGYQVALTNADDPRLEKFISRFQSGPQTPEPGAKCSGGQGIPKA